MRGQSTSSPFTVAVVSALWISVCRCGVSEVPWPGCDSGKLFLDKDLPEDALYRDCAASTWHGESTQKQHSIDTEHKPERVEKLCMNKSISYNHTIPSSGAYRPVGAESGEYLFCPPQRWLNNLHHGATVILHHPCVTLHERHLLSALAESCLSDYIITAYPWLKPHLPIALVTWGRTLEVSAVASPDVCDWLQSTTTTRNDLSDVKHIREYNLLLTKPAKQQTPRTKVSLRQCCEQTISSLLSEAKETNLESSGKKKRLNKKEEKLRIRRMRAAARKEQMSVKDRGDEDDKKHTSAFSGNLTDGTKRGGKNKGRKNSNSLGKSEISPPENRNLTDLSHPQGGRSKSVLQSQNQSLTAQPTTYLVSNMSAVEHESNDSKQNEGQPSVKSTNSTAGVEGIPAVVKTVGNNNVKSDSVVQTSRDEGTTTYQKKSGECDNCREGEQCYCTQASGPDAAVRQGLPRTPRTDEAVWAAAALGFLLVLLALSVLHTRLYRNWRTAPSLYWHNPQQDYDSVAGKWTRNDTKLALTSSVFKMSSRQMMTQYRGQMFVFPKRKVSGVTFYSPIL
uniref:Tumor protein p53 inducible protein 13 n=1 Tax=Cynoglossus semilaevis TaxID=244447 RepID=A0A3P8V0Z9_CYNSE